MNPPTISVVTPAYRAAATIARALDSVLAQTLPAAEVLVVDDGSPDDLAAAVAPYGDRVTLLRQPNGGAARARNRGLDYARGELIAFLDADDYWEPTRLERQWAVMRRHPEVGVVAGRYYRQAPGGERIAPPAASEPLYDRVLAVSGPMAFRVATRIWTSTLLVRRACLAGERFVSGLEPAEDRDLWARLVRRSPTYLVSEPLATAVLEPGSLSRTNIDRDCGNMLRVIHRNRDLLDPRSRGRWEADTYRRWAAGHLGIGQPRLALAPAWGRLRRQPWSPEGWWVLLKSATLSCTS